MSALQEHVLPDMPQAPFLMIYCFYSPLHNTKQLKIQKIGTLFTFSNGFDYFSIMNKYIVLYENGKRNN